MKFLMGSLRRAKKFVSDYPVVVDLVETDAGIQSQVDKIIDEIHGDFNHSLVKSIVGVADSTLAHLYDELRLVVPDGMDLADLCKKHHVILVPNHQSHADYVALTYLLYKRYGLPIYVAGGINLDVFPLGSLFRNSGCFFIRRKFGGDIAYKAAFEAYIAYLLTHDSSMFEFYFEGARSRTGKLMPPRFGLFQMLLEAHAQLNDQKKLLFVPVSVAHEQLPESKSHARELSGAPKKPESGTALLKIVQLVTKKLGSIHVRLGDPIEPNYYPVLRQTTQDLAFRCFVAVGKGIPVTPIALLSLVLLDDAAGALTAEGIRGKARDVISFCKHFNIPLAHSLDSNDWPDAMERALTLAIANKKVQRIEKEKLGQVFYCVRPEGRVEILYFKNMILHHFLVPCIITATWPNMFNGSITTVTDLSRFIMRKRKELKYEFYLPTTKDMLATALAVISYCVGREVKSLDECLALPHRDLYAVASKLRGFASAFTHIYEAYYVSGMALRHLLYEPFTKEAFTSIAREVFEMERLHGRVVKYPESFSVPNVQNCLDYFTNQKVLIRTGATYTVEDMKKLDGLIERFTSDLTDEVTVHFKLKQM